MVAAGSFRVVFFGTPNFAVPTLQRLLSSRHSVVGVVTQPDRPSGRGQKTRAAPVKACAHDARLQVLQPERLNDPTFMAALDGMHADIGVVVAYGKILSDAVLAVPAHGLVNVHASLLPRYRGAAPIHRAVMAGERETGITIMRVVKALDAGPVLATATRPIDGEETSEAVERDLARIGAQFLVDTLDRMAGGPVSELPQDEAAATYARRLVKEDGVVDWSRPAIDIHNQIRGLHPWPLAFSILNDERVILRQSRVAPGEPKAEPGVIVVAAGDDFIVATGNGALALTELQREGKRPAPARDFLSGQRVRPGDRFHSRP